MSEYFSLEHSSRSRASAQSQALHPSIRAQCGVGSCPVLEILHTALALVGAQANVEGVGVSQPRQIPGEGGGGGGASECLPP